MELIPVGSDFVDRFWPYASGLVSKACVKGPGDLNPADLREMCIEGSHQLWVLADKKEVYAVAITGIWTEGRKVCEWVAFASTNKVDWRPYALEIEEWAKAQDCIAMRSFSRLGMRKIVPDGYKTKGYIFEKALSDG